MLPRVTMIAYHITLSTVFKGVFQFAYGYKPFSILINFENFLLTHPFPFNRGQLNKHLAWRKLKEWETWKLVCYKVLTQKLNF